VAARFLGAGFQNVEGCGLVARGTKRTRRDLTSKASPEVPVATKRMCIVDRT